MENKEGLQPGWAMYQTFEDEWHIHPEDEDHLRFSTECACQPRMKENNGIFIVVHDSYDGREALEEAWKILNTGK